MTSSVFEHPVNQLIRERRSLRAYSTKAIEPAKVNSLFEAARWAPSSMNEQPWKYIYATKEQSELWNKIFESLNESNRLWVKEAPLLIVSLARKSFSRNGQPNSNAKYDLGAANALLSIQATDMGLNVHQLGGYDAVALRSRLNVPDEFDLGVVLAIGYPGDPATLPPHLKEREMGPRHRILQDAFVMNDIF